MTATFAAAALMLTSAILTFLIGVFALAADDCGGFRARLRVHLPNHRLGMGEHTDGNGVGRHRRCPLRERTGARVAAIIVTCLAIVVTFLWMPYYPTGSIVLIALDIVAIWGVATWNTSRKTP